MPDQLTSLRTQFTESHQKARFAEERLKVLASIYEKAYSPQITQLFQHAKIPLRAGNWSLQWDGNELAFTIKVVIEAETGAPLPVGLQKATEQGAKVQTEATPIAATSEPMDSPAFHKPSVPPNSGTTKTPVGRPTTPPVALTMPPVASTEAQTSTQAKPLTTPAGVPGKLPKPTIPPLKKTVGPIATKPTATNRFSEQSKNISMRAEMLARAIASDLHELHPQWEVSAKTLANEALHKMLLPEVQQARESYITQVGPEIAKSRYLEDALNTVLCNGRRIF